LQIFEFLLPDGFLHVGFSLMNFLPDELINCGLDSNDQMFLHCLDLRLVIVGISFIIYFVIFGFSSGDCEFGKSARFLMVALGCG
jgi:hypothetical protein